MIVGLGIDLCGIDRMRRALERHEGRLAARLFTGDERRYCEERSDPAQHYAARFAAKEAFLKALSVPAGLSWHEIEVRVGANGAPVLSLTGEAKKAAARLLVARFYLSLSHSGDSAAAVVIAEGG